MMRPATLPDRRRRRDLRRWFLPPVPSPVGLLTATLLAVAAMTGVQASASPRFQESSPPPTGGEPATDASDRSPRSAMLHYLEACRASDFETAAGLLDLSGLPADDRAAEGPNLARRLKVVLDRELWIDLDALSPDPAGNLDDGLPPQRELVGTIATASGPADILLDRKAGEGNGGRWRIAAPTVARIPALYAEFGYGRLGEILPPVLVQVSLLEVRLWQWIALLLSVVAAAVLSWLAARFVHRVTRRLVSRSATTFDDRLLEATVGPLRLGLALLLLVIASRALGLSVPALNLLTSLYEIAGLIAVAWLAVRIVQMLAQHVDNKLQTEGRIGARSVVPLGRRTLKAIIVGFTAIAVLQTLGINVTGLLAGLGVGGLAVALAAQKSVENLFGGITLISDQPVRVGDFCRFGDKVGIVEDVGLRSTRVRTLDRTVVSIPNAEFSQMQLENYARRDKIRLYCVLGLRYETSAEQLRYVLVEIRRLLLSHPKVLADPARVRFVGFGAYSLDLEIFAYVETADWSEFLAIREDIYLRIMAVVDESGTGFAFPSQTLYLGRDGGLDIERSRKSEEQVAKLRGLGELPMPDFTRDEIESFRGSLDYPPEGSVASSRGGGSAAAERGPQGT